MNIELLPAPIDTVAIAVVSIGFIGACFTFKAKVGQSENRIAMLEETSDQLRDKFVQLELDVAKECVKRTDLEKVEARIARRIDDIEHVVCISASQLTNEVKDMIRSILPARAGER